MDAAGQRVVKRFVAVGAALLLGLTAAQTVPLPAEGGSTVEPKVQVEVNYLLGYIGGSGCEFYRNGTWHDSQAARAHLNEKYLYIRARVGIASAEEFIEKVATGSSFTGNPYQVRCRGGAAMAIRPWLLEELARFREFSKRPASGPGV